MDRPLNKSSIPTDEEIYSRFEKIRNDPDKIEWEVLAYPWPYVSRRKKTLQKNAFYCAAPMFAFIFFASGFDLIETVTEPWTWILVGFGMFMGYYYSGLTVFNYYRHHYILSKHGLVTEEHAYSPPKATKVAKKMVGVLAVLTIISVVMIGPVALVGAGGLGITWLVLANVNFEKFGLMQRVSFHEDTFFIREHDDYDEPRDYFYLFHRFRSFEEHDGEISFEKPCFLSTDIFCEKGMKDEIIKTINAYHPYGEIKKDKANLFDGKTILPPDDIWDLEIATSPYND
ncbi:hypothetical protein [Photobacterium salinisoli]|uniref:hypothetical protein n=1 Tax=Photobacterium salinisoli TaxID=1616783 RepID=UPI0019697894|nr:hypothetical protein [Photobacterium salinisoli]